MNKKCLDNLICFFWSQSHLLRYLCGLSPPPPVFCLSLQCRHFVKHPGVATPIRGRQRSSEGLTAIRRRDTCHLTRVLAPTCSAYEALRTAPSRMSCDLK